MYEDILEDTQLDAVDGDSFRLYFRLLALLNRAKNRTGKITLPVRTINFLAQRSRISYSLPLLRQLEASSLLAFSQHKAGFELEVCKWPEMQETVVHTKTKTKTSTNTHSSSAGSGDPNPPSTRPLLNLIQPYDGSPLEKQLWIDSGIGEEILGAVDSECGPKATKVQRSGKARSITIARYRTYLRGDRVFLSEAIASRRLETKDAEDKQADLAIEAERKNCDPRGW